MRPVSSKRKMFLLTPIYPQPTGTATYAGFLLRDLRKFSTEIDICVVVDERIHPEKVPARFLGFPVISYSAFEPGATDIVVVFVANNEFHRFCLEELLKKRSEHIYSVVHDVQIFMIMSHLCILRKSAFDLTVFNKSVGGQLGNHSSRVTEWLQTGTIPKIAHYLIGCQGLMLESSRLIIVHSYYAALKLQLEYNVEGALPRIIVMQHPSADQGHEVASTTTSGARLQQCIFGLFGWISNSKRPHLIFEAFQDFIDKLDEVDRGHVKLRLVGKLVWQDFNTPEEIRKSRHPSRIEYFDYVPKNLFEKLMADCALIVNLRYPSCGETSGTLVHANTYGISTVTSEYQGFYEEPSTYKISIDPAFEKSELCEIFQKVYDEWRKKTRYSPSLPRFSEKLNVPDAFEIILRHAENEE